MSGEIALLICSFILSIIGLVAIGFLGFVIAKFIQTLTPYQLDKLKNSKISNTKIQKVMDEKVGDDMSLWIQEPMLLDLFPSGTAYAAEKEATPNLLASILKRIAPAIPSLVAGTPVEQVALGSAAQFGADMLGSEQGLKTISGVWQFLKLIAEQRKKNQVAIPKTSSSTTSNVEMKTI